MSLVAALLLLASYGHGASAGRADRPEWRRLFLPALDEVCDARLVAVWHSRCEAEQPASLDWLSAAETARIGELRFSKRRSEWLTGRLAAKEAVASLVGGEGELSSLARIEIRSVASGPAKGAPVAYVDGEARQVGVSLSTRAGWAIAVAATPAELGGDLEIGCDLEVVEPRSDAFVCDYLTPRERDDVAAPPQALERDVAANLIWSAKESALKLLRTGLRRDTRSVEVRLFPPRSSPSPEGWAPVEMTTEEGRRLFGWWRRYGGFLVTVATANELPPPAPLRDPPALEAATGH
jgi:4'-phosphopantetheinyl transferase